MSVELRPLGVKCNITCQYCYQNVHRDAGNDSGRYDLGAMKKAILEEGGPFHLFGGEPLLMRMDDLEEMLRWGVEQFGENGVQTNGVLVTPEHVALFRRYQVMVGVSIDGPGALNDARWAGSVEKTRSATRKSLNAINLLCDADMPPAVMLQLNRCNATAERLPLLFDWLAELDQKGVRSVRVHVLEIENSQVRGKYALSEAENLHALEQLLEWEQDHPGLRFDLTTDMRNLLLAEDSEAPCVWRACDAYTTEAVTGVNGDGSRHNCGLTDKEGIHFQKPAIPGYERYIALYYTPQAHNGCRGCRFFLACKGQCPGTGVDGDWRNRSEYCRVWKSLFSRLEAQLVAEGLTPLSLHPQREEWESAFVQAWQHNDNFSLAQDLTKGALQSAQSLPASVKNTTVTQRDFDDSDGGTNVVSLLPVAPSSEVPRMLDFALHSFRRITWASDEMQRQWQPVLESTTALCARYGAAVSAVVYQAGIYPVYAHELGRFSADVRALAVTDSAPVVEQLAVDSAIVSILLPELEQDDRKVLVLAGAEAIVGQLHQLLETLEEQLSAIDQDSSNAMTIQNLNNADVKLFFQLLGWPTCCASARIASLSAGNADAHWLMAAEEGELMADASDSPPVLQGHFGTNLLLAPVGIHLLNHLPCSAKCSPSIRLGEEALRHYQRLDNPVARQLRELLSWSFAWSSLHGIVEIKSPVFKLIHNDHTATAEKYAVHWQGTSAPASPIRGVGFPYREPPKLIVTDSRSYARGFANPLET